MKKQLLKTMLLLFALIAGSSSVWATEKSYTITFKDSGSSSDASTKRTTIADIISDGATYVSSITSPTNVYNARSGRGIKLGTSSKAGSLTLELAEAVTPTKITFNARKYNDTETSITVNGKDVTELTEDFDEYIVSYDGSTEVTSIAISTPSKRAYITQVTVYYEGSGSDPDPVAVTGVTVDPTEWTMEIGETKALTATVLPAEATNKNVTWSSNKESVATVNASGVVSAKDAGTATITVTTEDGSFTATCVITVNPAPAVALTLDFSTNILGLGEGSSNKATASEGFTYGGYTYTLAAADGYYYNTGYVMLGKSGSTFTFPAFPFNVSKIKVYGTSGASTSVVQNIYVDETAVSTETTGAQNKINEYKIDEAYQAAGNVYVLKVTSNHNTQISKIEIFGYLNTPAVTAAGWASYVTPKALRFAEGEAFAVTAAGGGSVTLAEVTDVPNNFPVLLKGEGAKTAIVLEESPVAPANELRISTGGDVEGYVLANKTNGVGFYKWAGGSLTSGKVYLPASAVAGAPDFLGFDGNATGIKSVDSGQVTVDSYYNLAGQRVAQPTKGLYIVNGKKVILK